MATELVACCQIADFLEMANLRRWIIFFRANFACGHRLEVIVWNIIHFVTFYDPKDTRKMALAASDSPEGKTEVPHSYAVTQTSIRPWTLVTNSTCPCSIDLRSSPSAPSLTCRTFPLPSLFSHPHTISHRPRHL